MIVKSGSFRVLAGLCGALGSIALVASFRMNPTPPPGLSLPALAAWAASRHDLMLTAAWMQGIGSLLIVVFSLALVELRRGSGPFAERLVALAGTTILMVSLVEVTFYIVAVNAAASADLTLGAVSIELIKAVQHTFLIAPALLLPLSVALLKSRTLPRAFAYTGLLLGLTLQTLGIIGLFSALQPVVDVVLIVQAAWFVFAGITFAVGRDMPEAAAGAAT